MEGALRQRSLLEWDRRLAVAYGRALKAGHSHLIVSQTLLPHLWREGWLGGRSFDVLMSRLPLQVLHERLDQAAALHPGSRTCADFRAPASLIEVETQALAAATRWITPHTEIAKLAGAKASLIPWSLPHRPPAQKLGRNIVFAASTLCRKGAFEMKEAMQDLSASLELTGGVLEGADFWEGIKLTYSGSRWLEQASVVVQPAFVEHAPRRLLQALAAGIPVIATEACGITGLPGVTVVPAGDAASLRTALIPHLHCPPLPTQAV